MLQRDEVIGGPMLDRLERSDRSAELKPALRIPDGQVEQMLRRADLFGGKQRRADVQRLGDHPVGLIGARGRYRQRS